MAQYEITYIKDGLQCARTVEADSWSAADAACEPGEECTGLILEVFYEDDSLAEEIRERIGEAMKEVRHG